MAGGGGGVPVGSSTGSPMVLRDGKWMAQADAAALNQTAPNLQHKPEQLATYTGPATGGPAADYFTPRAPTAGTGTGAPIGGPLGGGGGGAAVADAGIAKPPDSMQGLMSAIDGGSGDFKYLGAQSGQLRPLGQRLGVQDSMALAGLNRRVY
jgi:hypothetical protein